METKINVAEILKDKPKRTKLYTDTFGELSIEDIDTEDELGITLSSKDDDELLFYNDGRYNLYGEPILVPSKSMRDWLKFTWKKGDVLQHSEYPLTVIFESFEDDTYTSFKCKYCFNFESASKWLVSNSQCSTKHFYKVSEEEEKEFIRKVELNYNGKLNRETLEIEPAQPEFKDGDILSNPSTVYTQNHIFIFSKFDKDKDFEYHIALVASGEIVVPTYHGVWCRKDSDVRYATEEEKQKLFDALSKEGKAWDAEKKQIVDLKQKVELKPFDKVLCRNSKDDTWEADLFARLTRKEIDYTQSGKYLCVGDLWMYCIPYNEETAHLLGTTEEWKGGEG